MIILNAHNHSADEYYYLPCYEKKSRLTVVKWLTLSDTADKSQDWTHIIPALDSVLIPTSAH